MRMGKGETPDDTFTYDKPADAANGAARFHTTNRLTQPMALRDSIRQTG